MMFLFTSFCNAFLQAPISPSSPQQSLVSLDQSPNRLDQSFSYHFQSILFPSPSTGLDPKARA